MSERRNTHLDNDHELRCTLQEDSRIVLAGLGGVGGSLLQPLALFLQSLNVACRLVLVDGDRFQPRDASRQVFRAIGNKADVKAAEIIPLLENSDVTVIAVDRYLEPSNISQIIHGGDIILLCVDNHETRKLVSEHCATLSDVTLLSGGNDGVNLPRQRGTYGNVQIAIRRDKRDVTAPLTKYHPEIAKPKGKLPHEQSCLELAPAERQIYVTNFAVASAMLSALFACLCGRLTYQEVKLDILEARMLPQFESAR